MLSAVSRASDAADSATSNSFAASTTAPRSSGGTLGLSSRTDQSNKMRQNCRLILEALDPLKNPDDDWIWQ